MFICAFYTFLVSASASASTNGKIPGLERLRAGEVVMEETRLDESGGSVKVRIYVRAPAERAWYIISRCQYARRYMAGMQDCQILVDQPDRALTRHVIDAGFLAPTLDYTFETRRRPFERMDIELVEGNLKAMNGYWRFEPFESGILLEHEVHVQPKVPAPRWLVRKKLKNDLPRMMRCIRGLAGGSLDPGMEKSDLAVCHEPEAPQDQ